MSDDNKNLNIQITTKADLAGAQAANAAVSDLTGSTKQNAAATRDLGDAEKKTAEHTEKHAEGGRELHRALHSLDQIVPGLGEALKVAFRPEEIGIVGALVAFETLKSVLEDISALEEIKLANFTGDKAAVEAVRDAYEKAAVAARLFVDEQSRLDAAGLSAGDIATRQIQIVKNLTSAQEQYNTAQHGLAESMIEANEKNGLISHQQALQQKFALDVEYARKKLQLDEQTAAAEIAAKQRQLATEKAQLAQADADRSTDEANAASAAAAKGRHDKDIEAQKKNIEDAQKTLEELGKSHGSIVEGKINDETVQKLGEYYQKYVGGDASKVNLSDQFLQLQEKMKTVTNRASWDFGLTNFLDRTIGSQGGAEGLAKYQGAQQQIQDAQKQLGRLEESQFRVDLNAERGKKQLDATDEAVRSLSASVEKLAREIPQAKADNVARQNNAAGVANLDLRAEAVKNGLRDPGNIFRATAAPQSSQATPEAATQTPWRYDYNQPAGDAPRPSPENQAHNDLMTVINAGQDLFRGVKLDENHIAILKQVLEMQTGHEVRSGEILDTIKSVVSSSRARQIAETRELQELRREMEAIGNTASQAWHNANSH